MGAHPASFSRGAHCRRSSRTQADFDAARARTGPLDCQHRCAVAHAASEVSELQNRASSVSVVVPRRSFASSSDGRCQRTWRRRGLDEEASFIDATFAMAKGGGAEISPAMRGKG